MGHGLYQEGSMPGSVTLQNVGDLPVYTMICALEPVDGNSCY